jgi:CHASE2 domain-containing sensor protein
MARQLSILRHKLVLAGDKVGRRLRKNFYLYVAMLFTLLALVDAISFNYIVGMRQKAFDLMVRNRLLVAEPAADIVIVDIDEKSLAAMAPDYGRWPWPRQVLAEFVEMIEVQRPNAIVFDILFSDADLFNPDSDSYFDEVITRTQNTWFPLVRLDSAQDGQSELKVEQVPGARRISSEASADATIALVLPHFAAVQTSGRLGFNNIWPDADGIVRAYTLRRNEGGFELPSLPLAVVRAERPQIGGPDAMLINWRGEPFTYPYVSFADVYLELQKERPTRPADEFAGKIVIIGSTAPSLFDIKATAVSRQFPGVEILATAIDNLRRGDWLRVPQARLLYLLVTLAILWATAWAFYRHGASSKLDRFYGLSQFLLIGIAYAAINLANLYINLTGPVMFGFVYYSLARYYAFATARALDDSVVTRRQAKAGEARGCLLALHFDVPTREEASLEKLAAALETHCRQAPSAEWLSGRQRGLWRLCENILVLCWLCRGDEDEARWQAIRQEAATLTAALPEVLNAKGLADALPFDTVYVSQAEGVIGSDESRDWRALLGRALQQREGVRS